MSLPALAKVISMEQAVYSRHIDIVILVVRTNKSNVNNTRSFRFGSKYFFC